MMTVTTVCSLQYSVDSSKEVYFVTTVNYNCKKIYNFGHSFNFSISSHWATTIKHFKAVINFVPQ